MSTARLRRIFPLLAIAVMFSATEAMAQAGGSSAAGSSQGAPTTADRGSPGRFDLWTYYFDNADGSTSWRETARLTKPLPLGNEGWRVTLRADLPVIYTDQTGTDNRGGDWEFGWGDALAQVVFSTPELAEDLKLTFGFRSILPTGDDAPFGSSQWAIGPQAGFSYDAGDWAEGLTLAPTVRWLRGFAPTRDGVTRIRQWDLYPTVSYKFAPEWTISFWEENPIIYNDRSNNWFVPLDGMIVRSFGERWQIGLGAATALVDDDARYDNVVYGRISAQF